MLVDRALPIIKRNSVSNTNLISRKDKVESPLGTPVCRCFMAFFFCLIYVSSRLIRQKCVGLTGLWPLPLFFALVVVVDLPFRHLLLAT
jgi:hypothetical protein